MGSLSPVHWLLVALVVLLLFGPQRLAGVGKGLGEGIRAFKRGVSDEPEPKQAGEAQKQLSDKKESES